MKGKKALLNIISGVDSYYRDLLADDFETIYEDLNKLEVLAALKTKKENEDDIFIGVWVNNEDYQKKIKRWLDGR